MFVFKIMAMSVVMMMMMIVAGFVMAMSMMVMFVAMSVMGVVTIYRNKHRTKQKKCEKFSTHFAPLPPKQLALTDSLRNLPVFLARGTSCQLDDVASMRTNGFK